MRIPIGWKWQSGMKENLMIVIITSGILITALIISILMLASYTKNCDDDTNSDYPSVSSLALKFDPLRSKPDATFTEKENKKERDGVCITRECVHTASKILKNLNTKVEPCDDFYQFACGGFVRSASVPDDKVSVDVYDSIRDKVQMQLRASIEEPSCRDEPRPFRLAKNLYNTCLNTTAIEEAGLKPLQDIMGKLGKWPVVEGDDWRENDFDWVNMTGKLLRLGYPPDQLISFGIDTEWNNNTKKIISLDQASFGVLPRDFLIQSFQANIVQVYYRYMIEIAVLLGAGRERATAELEESLEFEIKLANIALPDVERRNFTVLNNLVTLTELGERYPSINWESYVRNVLPRGVRVDGDEIVRVVVPGYISGLEELLKTTPKRVQANYILWKVAAVSVSLLTEDLRKLEVEYSVVLYGKSERSSRWKECLDFVSRYMGISVGALYVREYFKDDAKRYAAEIVNDIRKEFTRILDQAEWMDEATRSKAFEKAESMSSHIAYAAELLDDKKLEEYYADLELSPNDLIGNNLNITRFLTNNLLRDIKKPVNLTDWTSHATPATVNTFYTFGENSIQLPAGILQRPFFSYDRPRYMNYGSIGFLIGHEITHGFDDKGSQFDKDGNLIDWWAPQTKEEYLRKAKCFVRQYGNYTVEAAGMKVNGILTQGENIADNGGVKAAYYAYREWAKRNGPEPKLPGLKYTPEQMFWISAANIWCTKYRPDTAVYELTTDVHSPHRFRVIGALSNIPEFSADFECPAGSAMNPAEKCSVW